MVMGRPQKHDRKKVASDLVAWAKRDDSINLCKFCCTYEPILVPRYLSHWANEDEDFRLAYEAAKACLGARREEKLNSDEMHVKAYDLNAKTYDYFLNEQAQATAKFYAQLKSEHTQQYSQEEIDRARLILDQVSRNQKIAAKQ